MKYIILICTILACTNPSKQKTVVSTEKLDTIKTQPSKITAAPQILESAFVKGTVKKNEKVTLTFYGITLGNIKISTGRIIACDPNLIEEYGKPFTRQFP